MVAEEVYERGLNTYIPKDSYCASACSFVFFAGRQRLAEGRLGVHQISAPEMTGEQAQFGVSDIVACLLYTSRIDGKHTHYRNRT